MDLATSRLTARTVRPNLTVVNTLVPTVDETSGRRLERYVRQRWSREQGGITGLASETGITRETLYTWFRGETDPSLSNLAALAAALKVRRTEILAAMDGEAPTIPLDVEFETRVEQRVLEVLRRELGGGRG